jgi:hypothetical protein
VDRPRADPAASGTPPTGALGLWERIRISSPEAVPALAMMVAESTVSTIGAARVRNA